MSTHSDRLPISVITGFLGSGKTTLIAALLQRPELARSAVIVNEFGEIGLDHELIESSEEDLVELSTGCLCCVMRGDLVNAVARLLALRDSGRFFDRIVLETTGLADPAPILHALIGDPFLQAVLRPDRTVVTIDAVTGLSSLAMHEESRRQAALADVFLITKTDIDPTGTRPLLARLAAINPGASMFPSVHGKIDPALILGPADAAPGSPEGGGRHLHGVNHSANHGAGHHHGMIGSVSLRLDRPIPAVALTLFLQALAETLGADLLRIKGLIAIAEAPETPVVVHGVQHVFHPMRWLDRWPSADRVSRLVLIGNHLDAGWIAALLATIEEEVAIATGQDGAGDVRLTQEQGRSGCSI